MECFVSPEKGGRRHLGANPFYIEHNLHEVSATGLEDCMECFVSPEKGGRQHPGPSPFYIEYNLHEVSAAGLMLWFLGFLRGEHSFEGCFSPLHPLQVPETMVQAFCFWPNLLQTQALLAYRNKALPWHYLASLASQALHWACVHHLLPGVEPLCSSVDLCSWSDLQTV